MSQARFRRRRGIACAVGTAAYAQPADWYPSPWGPADQRGAANRITPEKVLEAKTLITRGTVYQLGHVYESTMPLFGTRHFSSADSSDVRAARLEQLMFHDEIMSGELGQVGTQFDGLGHIGIGDFLQRQRPRDFSRPDGLRSSASRTSARS